MIKCISTIIAISLLSTQFALRAEACWPQSVKKNHEYRAERPILLRVEILGTIGNKGEIFGELYEAPAKISVNVIETIRGPVHIEGTFEVPLSRAMVAKPIITLDGWSDRQYANPRRMLLQQVFNCRLDDNCPEFVQAKERHSGEGAIFYLWAVAIEDDQIHIFKSMCDRYSAYLIPDYVEDYAASKGRRYY